MIGLLDHPNSTVRYWTAETLKNNTSPKIKVKEVQKLVEKALKEG
jgi:hypothetical protein